MIGGLIRTPSLSAERFFRVKTGIWPTAHPCGILRGKQRTLKPFLHYSPNTFTNRQWGTGSETPGDFCPDRQDPDQWVRVCRDAGMKMLIPTLKHHDGFCQWHTESTDFQVSACPETQDIAAALSQACAAYGMELGVAPL